MLDFGMTGKNYIVTGGAGSIGRAIVEQIIDCGGNVTAVDIDEKTLKEMAEVLPAAQYKYRAIDLSDVNVIRKNFAEMAEEYGQVHGLCNCVGIVTTTTIGEISQEAWDKVIAINLTGVFAANQVILQNMLKFGYGNIVNVSSIAGKLGGGLLGNSAYATSKGGLNAMTKVIAKTYGPQGIRCNAVCPGWTVSRMVAQYMDESTVERLKAMCALRRPGTPEEMAYPCVFLMSDLSSYMNGEISDADGGVTWDS